MIVAAAVGVTLERKQRREEFRIIPIKPIPAVMMLAGARKIMVEFTDLSANGAGLIVTDKQFSKEQLQSTESVAFLLKSSLHQNQVVRIPATVLNIKSDHLGVQFKYQNMQQKAEIVDLIYGDSKQLEARLERRRKRISFFSAYLYFTKKSVAGLVNNVMHILHHWVQGVPDGFHQMFIVEPRSLWAMFFSDRSGR